MHHYNILLQGQNQPELNRCITRLCCYRARTYAIMGWFLARTMQVLPASDRFWHATGPSIHVISILTHFQLGPASIWRPFCMYWYFHYTDKTVMKPSYFYYGNMYIYKINWLVQEKRNSIANTLELRLSCTNPSRWCFYIKTAYW